MLEHQPEPGAQPALPGTWTPQVLAAGDHGGGDLQRAEGGTLPQPSGKVRFPAAVQRIFSPARLFSNNILTRRAINSIQIYY